MFNSFLTSGDSCRLLITYSNSLDQDQNQWKKVYFKKKASRRQQKHEKLPSMQRVKEGVVAISAIRRQAVKCSDETAQLLRITRAFSGNSCNKYLFLIGRFVDWCVNSEDKNEFDHPCRLKSAFNAAHAHNIYTTVVYWIVASVS